MAGFVRRIVVVSAIGSVLTVGCAGGDDDAGVESIAEAEPTTPHAATIDAPTTTTADAPTIAATTAPTPGLVGFPRYAALQDCFAARGVDAHVPAPPPSPRVPVGPFPADLAADAWAACRSAYVAALHESIAGFGATELPSEDEALAFADCMATLGWITPLGPIGPVVKDLSDYLAANAACRTPVEGDSVAASYCRFVQAIWDRAAHDSSMSITGVPYTDTHEARREAAVALYDEALRIAPEDLVTELHVLQDGFRDGARIPEAAWEPVIDYHLSTCGVWVHLGSLD